MPFAETLALLEESRRLYLSSCDWYEAEFRAEQELFLHRRFRNRIPGRIPAGRRNTGSGPGSGSGSGTGSRPSLLSGLADSDPEFQAICTKWQILANNLTEAYKILESSLEAKLRQEALEEIPAVGGFLGLVHTTRAADFRTQGFGASRYAQGAAELAADIARYYGFRAEVLPVGQETCLRDGCRYQDYGVFVNVSDTGWQMLLRRDGPPLREWLKSCWRRGLNPRVYRPMLPAGLEEELQIDYFGNDLTGGRDVGKDSGQDSGQDSGKDRGQPGSLAARADSGQSARQPPDS